MIEIKSSKKFRNQYPKDVLKNENLIQRLNWYYKDLIGWQRVAAHGILLLFIILVAVGVYFFTEKITPESPAYDIVGIAISIIFSILGISFQGFSLKKPRTA